MKMQPLSRHLDEIKDRALPDGGFQEVGGGGYRPDATAWAILALAAAGEGEGLLESSRNGLEKGQLADGRVSISPDHPESFWLTPLAILAWKDSPGHLDAQSRAIHFLTSTTGTHYPRKADSPVAHDTAIRGWPWVENTHSWVEPTALSLIALRAAGHGNHPRVTEAVSMLLDRQLPHGGWNYGNTKVYGQELRPMPDLTGLALQALAGRVPRGQVERSIAYLKSQVVRLRTPIALGWGLLALGAWADSPGEAQELVREALDRQSVYGSYGTCNLSLLMLAFLCPGGLNLS